MGKKLLLVIGAALAGAGGLGLEVLVTNLAGLTIGYGRSAPVGIAVFISGWALGAWFAGTRRGRLRWLWIAAGLSLAVMGYAAPRLLVLTAEGAGGTVLLWTVTVLVLLSVAFPQGVLLPLLARHWPLGRRGDLGWLFGANLLGAACGASLIADSLPAHFGRASAAAAAGGSAALVALLGAALVGSSSTDDEGETPASEPRDPACLDLREAGILLAVVTAWIGTLEWFGVRLGLLWFGGMQATFGNILVASMVALAGGAALLPRILPRTRAGLAILALSCALSSCSLFFLPALLGGSESWPALVRALCLIGPALAPFGAWVPMLHRAVEGESGRRLGQLLGWEAAGILVGLPLSQVLLLPAIGMHGAVLFWCAVGLCLFVRLLPRGRRVMFGIVSAAAFSGLAQACVDGSPALSAPPLSKPQFELLEFKEDAHFAVSVVEDGLLGERTLLTDGFRAAASGRDYAYMRALGHLPLLLHPRPVDVGVLAFGTGTTAGSVSLHPQVESIEVLELSETVTDNAGRFVDVNRDVLRDPRVRLEIGDGRHILGRRRGAYDVLTMEPLLPDSPFGVYLYTEGFYARAKRALKPGGLLCQWVPPHALEPRVFDTVVGTFTSAFEWSSVWLFGTQVVLLGSQHAPQPSVARFPTDEGELQLALAGLGLDTLEGVLARFVLSGEAFPSPERPLTDLDPWVIYLPGRTGAEQIADLPRNLARLRALARPMPLEWWVGLGPEADRRGRGMALVRQAREAFAAERARSLGVDLSDGDLAHDSAGLLERAAGLLGNDPGLLRLEAEIEFVEGLLRAKLLLAGDPGQEAAAAAAALLTRAAALRPERADVHAYIAVALERLGSERAHEALARALELCPRLFETRVGQQLSAWGFER